MREDYRIMADFLMEMNQKEKIWIGNGHWAVKYMNQLMEKGYCVPVDDKFYITKKGKELVKAINKEIIESSIFSDTDMLSWTLGYALDSVFNPIFGNIELNEVTKIGNFKTEHGHLYLHDVNNCDILHDGDVLSLNGKKVEVIFKVVD